MLHCSLASIVLRWSQQSVQSLLPVHSMSFISTALRFFLYLWLYQFDSDVQDLVPIYHAWSFLRFISMWFFSFVQVGYLNLISSIIFCSFRLSPPFPLDPTCAVVGISQVPKSWYIFILLYFLYYSLWTIYLRAHWHVRLSAIVWEVHPVMDSAPCPACRMGTGVLTD